MKLEVVELIRLMDFEVFSKADIGVGYKNTAFLALRRVLMQSKVICSKGGNKVDQKKTGGFLKELRKEKEMTQEQIAEQFNVSSRTVSRWENGNNMPDLDILIEISDFYEIDLREILNGERKSENMNKDMKETVLQAVDYTNTEAEKYNKRVRICNSIALLLMVAYMSLKDTGIYMDNYIVRNGLDFAQGLSVGMILCGIIMSSHYGIKVRAFKQRLLRKSDIG